MSDSTWQKVSRVFGMWYALNKYLLHRWMCEWLNDYSETGILGKRVNLVWHSVFFLGNREMVGIITELEQEREKQIWRIIWGGWQWLHLLETGWVQAAYEKNA